MKRTLRGITFALLICTAAFAVDGEYYGLHTGSVGGFIGGGTQLIGGAHPTVTGGVDIGLNKYIGLYAEATGTLAAQAQVGMFFGGGGIMIAGTNKSRIVPFARFGMDYGRLQVFQYGGLNMPVARYGGGFDAYMTKHFGIETQVAGLRSLGKWGGDNTALITFGIFYRR